MKYKLLDGEGLSYLLERLKEMFSKKVDKTTLDAKLKTDVPENAKFTDTTTTINGKTGTITKADIVALGIPSANTNTTYSEISTTEIDTGTATSLRTLTGRRAGYIVDKAKSYVNDRVKKPVPADALLTESEIKKVKVNNATSADMVDGYESDDFVHSRQGLIRSYTEMSAYTSGTIDLNDANTFYANPGSTMYISINGAPPAPHVHSITLIIELSRYTPVIYFPAEVRWANGEIPTINERDTVYVLTFMTVNGGNTWLGMFGGKFSAS